MVCGNITDYTNLCRIQAIIYLVDKIQQNNPQTYRKTMGEKMRYAKWNKIKVNWRQNHRPRGTGASQRTHRRREKPKKEPYNLSIMVPRVAKKHYDGRKYRTNTPKNDKIGQK